MAQSARVTSIDALRDFRRALRKFKEQAEEALTAASMEIQRAMDQLFKDQPRHWQALQRKLEEAVTEARLELNRRKISRVFGRMPDVTVQETNLRKARQRLEQVEKKLEAIRRWRAPLEKAISEYEGPAGQLTALLTIDVERALAALEQRLSSLEAYVKLAPPEAAPPASGQPPPDDAGPPPSRGGPS